MRKKVEISTTKDSVLPYYIMEEELEKWFFNIVYKNGKNFCQYEQDGNVFIAHHWTEINLPLVEKLQIMCIGDNGVFCADEIENKPNRSLYFRYRITRSGRRIPQRRCVYGYDDDGKRHSWRIDKTFKIKKIEGQ